MSLFLAPANSVPVSTGTFGRETIVLFFEGFAPVSLMEPRKAVDLADS